MVYNDLKNLTYFQNARVLTRRQARQAQFLRRFDFLITYHPRVQRGKVDALLKLSYLAPQPREPTFDHQKQVIMGLDWLQLLIVNASKALEASRLLYSM